MLSFLSAALSVSISHQLDTITTLGGLFAYTRLLWCIVRTRDLTLQRAIKQIVQWLQSTSATCVSCNRNGTATDSRSETKTREKYMSSVGR